MYWRGGPKPTADINVPLQAGATLGGGTTINWTNCLRTKPWVREQWAREHGLEGRRRPRLRPPPRRGLGAHLRVNDGCSRPQRHPGADEARRRGARLVLQDDHPQRRRAALLARQRRLHRLRRPDRRQAVDRRDLPGGRGRARAPRSSSAARASACSSRAAAPPASRRVYTDPDSGRSAQVTVRAPRVVVACGALESPALLLRSGIGGPAAGNYLRLHPCTAVIGHYARGPARLVGRAARRARRRVRERRGRLRLPDRGAQYATGTGASALPFTSGRRAQGADGRLPRRRHLHRAAARPRPRPGHDRRRRGRPCPGTRSPTSSTCATPHRAIDAQVRLHEAAGARRDRRARGRRCRRWRARRRPRRASSSGSSASRCGAGGCRLFSAHQMGTCRMGADPQTSVANPCGELHDTPGVWIGDASAFPTASGTNPMITIMALATPHRRGDHGGELGRRGHGYGYGQRAGPNRRSTRHGTSHPTQDRPRPALHRRRVGRARRATARSRSINSTTEEVIGRVPEGTPRTSTARSRRARRVRRLVAGLARRARSDCCAAIAAELAERGRGDRRADRARGGHADRPVADDPGRPAGDDVRLDARARRADRRGRRRSATR